MKEHPTINQKDDIFALLNYSSMNRANLARNECQVKSFDMKKCMILISFQKCDEWKPDIKTFSADLSIEGANISRFIFDAVCMEFSINDNF